MASFFSEPRNPKVAPPKNADAVRRALFRETYLAGLDTRHWQEREDDALNGALRMQLQEEAFRRLYAERTQRSHLPQAEKPRAFQEASHEIREARTDELWEMQQCKTDWHSISRRLVAKQVHRDARSCFTRFVQVLHPQVNRRAFTKLEDMALLQLATAHGGFHWERVAEEAGSGRTPWQCFARYQRALNPTLAHGQWTEEESSRLESLWGESGARGGWAAMSARLGEGRIPLQVRQRLGLLSRMHDKQVGAWSALESERLCLAVQIYGPTSWTEISRHVPGRALSACAAHFWAIESESAGRLRGGDPSEGRRGKVRRPWREEEDAALLRAIDQYGAGSWNLISRELPGRTASACFGRFQTLNPSSMADMYDILLATKGKMIPSKRHETLRRRSDLIASDFALQLFEVPAPGSDENCTVLTTGDPRLDRHLRRVNERRLKGYREMSRGRAPLEDDQERRPEKFRRRRQSSKKRPEQPAAPEPQAAGAESSEEE